MTKLHREEERFTIRLDLVAEFDENYQGDDDGFAWYERWKSNVRPRVVAAVFEALREARDFDSVPTSRGANPDDELEITITRRPSPK
jgi:hypothetical protein